MSLGNKTTGTTTTNTQLPQHITDAQTAMIAKANQLLDPFFNQNMQYGIMGQNPLQDQAQDLAQQAAKNLFTNPLLSPYGVFGMGDQWAEGGVVPGATAQQATAQQAQAAQANAAQLAPGEIAPFMSPYIDTALNPVLDRLRQQQAEVQSKTGADAAAAHMFGGSREAVQRSLADRNYRDTLATTTGGMLNQGYQQASQLASMNAQQRQAANLLNAQLSNAINSLNAQLGTDVSKLNATLGTDVSKYNAGLGQQFQNLQFQGAQNDAARYLQAVGLQGNMQTSYLTNQLAAIDALNKLGGQQQQLGQAALDLPYKRLQELIAMNNALRGGSTQTQTTQKPVDIASIGIGGLGLLGALSDREDKTDIKRLGIDPTTGLPQYAYRYKDDPKSYPKVVGPMAQDLEKAMPGITRLIGGHRIIPNGSR